jgi:hypothetical protein
MRTPLLRAVGPFCVLLGCANSAQPAELDPCDPESPDYDAVSCGTAAGGSKGSGGAKPGSGGSKAGGTASGGTRRVDASTGAGGSVKDPLQVPDATPGTGYQPLSIVGGPDTAPDGVPPGLPSHFAIGIGEITPDEPWLASSGVPWDYAYKYLTSDWSTWGNPVIFGSYASGYALGMDALGIIPAFQYYVMTVNGDESQFYSKVQNKDTMRTYFTAFRHLMERAKDFDKPVLVMLEADGFGFLENQAGDNPNAGAAVASTGLPELSGLPNTVAGWGLAFLQIRKSVGASKAILGIHVSHWAGGIDLGTAGSVSNLQQYVDRTYNFLAPLGLKDNVTGYRYDVLVGDPSDRDADYYKYVRGDNGAHWWDTSASASTASRSFNRYAEWLRLWRVKAQMRWVLWQVPCGNSMSPNNQTDGYKDNRPEYWLGSGANRQKFADAGVIAVLFGPGAGGNTGYANDNDYIRSESAAYLASPLALP